MTLAIEELLRPITAEQPVGPLLRDRPEYDALNTYANAKDKIPWTRVREGALELSRLCRDLRAWVWLARSSLVTDGLAGLADGLELIARGLERYWQILPPVSPDKNEPGE